MFSQLRDNFLRKQPPKFSVEEVLNAYMNVNGLSDLNQSAIDKVTHYLLNKEDEYSTYIRLKEQFESAPVAPEQERELTGYRYSDGTGICVGDAIECELPRKFLRAPYSLPPTRMCGEVIKVYAEVGTYNFHISDADVDGSYAGNAPTLKSIVETASHIKKVN